MLEDRAIIVDDVRVRATGRAVDLPTAEHISSDPGQPIKREAHASVQFLRFPFDAFGALDGVSDVDACGSV